ncbi:MAG: type III-B CRISPR-associated protein Cas10/Cmr2, partial [Fimbriimonadales bacterium]|nr:type III-B CRISPR-associated protein Cas10/Cmr2 [Fimbriimonadales bacterium]
LTAGSKLLSQIAGEVAKFLEDKYKATLIYPANAAQPSAPNRILCCIETDESLHKVAQKAWFTAQEFLKRQWWGDEQQSGALRDIAKDIPEFSNALDEDLLKHQLKNFLEFYAAWAPLEDDSQYPQARQQAEALLAARKALRDFRQPPLSQNRPKSPLDPAYDSVFKEYESGYRLPSALVGKPPLYLKPRETLDVISLIKRYRGYSETRGGAKVPSTTEMAFRALENFLLQEATDAIRELESWSGKLNEPELSTFVHQSRWMEAKDEHRYDPRWQQYEDQFPEAEQAAAKVRGVLHRRGIPEEYLSYYAILVADGDHMGRFLDGLTAMTHHQRFSAILSEFADDAKDLVNNRYSGYLIYAGGDDVLALLPANCAIACAQQLASRFNARMEQYRKGLESGGIELSCLPTLSAGVAIVHALEHLHDALGWARRAEQAAKAAGRDRLAVAYYPRSGEAITVTLPWSECREWGCWVNAFRLGLAKGLPYELLQLAREYECLEPNAQRAIILPETQRVIERKEGHEYAPVLPAWLRTANDLRQLAHLMIIARMLALYPEVQV